MKKRYFLKNAVLFLSEREKVLNNFKCKTFPIKNPDKIPKPEPGTEPTVFSTLKLTKRQAKKSSSKLYWYFCDKIANDETNINTKIFSEYCKY